MGPTSTYLADNYCTWAYYSTSIFCICSRLESDIIWKFSQLSLSDVLSHEQKTYGSNHWLVFYTINYFGCLTFFGCMLMMSVRAKMQKNTRYNAQDGSWWVIKLIRIITNYCPWGLVERCLFYFGNQTWSSLAFTFSEAGKQQQLFC